jgi:hypothetical protein
MGRRAWLFCWTELGAEQVGIMHLRAPANIINLSTFIPSWINVSKAA